MGWVTDDTTSKQPGKCGNWVIVQDNWWSFTSQHREKKGTGLEEP